RPPSPGCERVDRARLSLGSRPWRREAGRGGKGSLGRGALGRDAGRAEPVDRRAPGAATGRAVSRGGPRAGAGSTFPAVRRVERLVQAPGRPGPAELSLLTRGGRRLLDEAHRARPRLLRG